MSTAMFCLLAKEAANSLNANNKPSGEDAHVNLEARLPQLLPRAIAWAEAIAADVAARGVVLHPSALADAKTVGVQRPEKIRLLMVDQLPSVRSMVFLLMNASSPIK